MTWANLIFKFEIYTLVRLLLLSNCGYISKENHKPNADTLSMNTYNQDSIILLLRAELENPDSTKILPISTNHMIDIVEQSKSDKSVLFPYLEIDSIVLYYADAFRKGEIDKNKCKILNKEEKNSLFELLNNPLYFQWGECGTAILDHRFIFYSNRRKKATVDVSCESNMVKCSPANPLTRDGGLNDIGKMKLHSILNDH